MSKPIVPKNANNDFTNPRVLFWDRNDCYQVEVQVIQSWEDPSMKVGKLCVWDLKKNKTLLDKQLVIPNIVTDEVKEQWIQTVSETIKSHEKKG